MLREEHVWGDCVLTRLGFNLDQSTIASSELMTRPAGLSLRVNALALALDDGAADLTLPFVLVRDTIAMFRGHFDVVLRISNLALGEPM